MAPTSKLGRGKPLKYQTKEVLHKLCRYFEKEIERDPNSTVTAVQLVSHATGISLNAIKRVVAEFKGNLGNVIIKKENKSMKRRYNMISDDFDAQAIRRIIHSFYTKNEEFPIMKDLYLILKGDIDYQGSLCTLRKHITKLGFKWMEKEDNNKILIEKHELRYTRVQYLSKIELYRHQGRPIVYTGEVAVESNRIASKQKPDGSSTMLKWPAKSRLIILLAGDRHDFFLDTLFMFDAYRRDWKEEIERKKENFDQMEKWFKTNVIPNLKPNSVVVVDAGSPFHNRVSNAAPNFNSRKKDMMDYLSARNVPYSPEMYKSQLFQLVLMNKDKYCDYKTDTLLREYGHTVLRMPPHHPDLNPVKNLLSVVKEYIGKDLCLEVKSVMKIAKEKVTSLNTEDWKIACREAEAEENNLKAIDKVIDEVSEQTFEDAADVSEDSEMEEDIGSDQDSMDSD